MSFTLADLDARVATRSAAVPSESYTAKLLQSGIERCAKKFGEESAELLIAAAIRDHKGTTAEAADVLYHLLVLLRASDVPLDEVMAELERRTAQTGLEEKASRQPGTGV
ncbi:phosphoribosyl-ATP diphosphatase [Devosia sp.]|uniref:phosphoribosyl-ATP diphosphatase n=1 Tax=Devosia sp. TaxID=1871048 RepID=UPI003A918AB9